MYDIWYHLTGITSLLFLLQVPSVSTAKRLHEAQKCSRWASRRDALCNPFEMAMPQVTRENLERERALRKLTISERLNRLVCSKIQPLPEPDLA